MRNIRIEAGAFLWWAVLLLLLPLRWLIAAFFAAIIHELCHYLAIRAMGGEVEVIFIRPGGAVMQTTPLNPVQELICALAGPLGGLFLLFFARWIPLTALCALVQSVFNLLPIFPLDGGRVLQCAVRLLRPHGNADRICKRVGGVCLSVLIIVSLLAAWRFSLGVGVWMPLMILVQRFFPGKRPCKTARLALQ